MKKYLFALFSLASTGALAIDHAVPCQGASCKVVVETKSSGNAKVNAAQFDGSGQATLGPGASVLSTHIANTGNLSADKPTLSLRAGDVSGNNRWGLELFSTTSAARRGFMYADNLGTLHLGENGGNGIRFWSNDITGTQVGSVAGNGNWTLGPTASSVTHIVNGQVLRLVPGTNGISRFEVNAATTSQISLSLARTGGTAANWEMYIPSGSTDLRWNNGSLDMLKLTSPGALSIAPGGGGSISLNGGTAFSTLTQANGFVTYAGGSFSSNVAANNTWNCARFGKMVTCTFFFDVTLNTGTQAQLVISGPDTNYLPTAGNNISASCFPEGGTSGYIYMFRYSNSSGNVQMTLRLAQAFTDMPNGITIPNNTHIASNCSISFTNP